MDPRLWIATGALFALGAFLLWVTHRVRRPDAKRRAGDWTKFAAYVLVIHGLLGSAALGSAITALLLTGIVAGAAVELHAARAALPRWARIPASLAVAFLLGHALLGSAPAWPSSFALLILLVAACDSFAQLWGRLAGTRNPLPRLSPEKTLEGFAGGAAATLLVSLLCGFLAPGLGAGQRILLGVVTAAAAMGGDLLFSAVKRRAGIKNFSERLPGHGGILDRFDSLVLAAPVYTWTRVLIEGSSGH